MYIRTDNKYQTDLKSYRIRLLTMYIVKDVMTGMENSDKGRQSNMFCSVSFYLLSKLELLTEYQFFFIFWKPALYTA